MQKWLVLAAGVVLQTILGGIYAWSAFVPSLTETHGLNKGECGMIFGVMISVFTLSMILAGRVLHSRGPRLTAGIGAALFGAGYLIASFSGGRFGVILLGISVVTGTGLGFGYVCPLTVGIKWFPKNKGLVTGISVAGFGGGAILLSTLAQHLLGGRGWDVLQVFRLIGILFGAVALISAVFITNPPRSEETRASAAHEGAGAYLKSRVFQIICLGLFAGTFAGLLAIGNLKPMVLAMGLTQIEATWSISIFACGNAVGRILWGQLHDHLGSRRTVLLSLVFLAAALAPLLFPIPRAVILLAVLLCGIGFSACFVVYASSIVDLFGSDMFARLYPICFLGYGLAGLTSPGVGGWIADLTNSYTWAVALSLAVLLLAIVPVHTSRHWSGTTEARRWASDSRDSHPA